MENNLKWKEKIIEGAIIVVLLVVLGRIFYGAWWCGVLLVPIGRCLYKSRVNQIKKVKKEKVEKQFKDMLISVSDGLNVGHSVENAVKESYKDVARIYGEDSEICEEIRIMVSKMKLNIPLEKVFGEFAVRSGLEDAYTFSQTFFVAKKKGGSLTDIIKNVTDTIVLKQSVKEEINVAINEKKLEQKIMTFIPIFLIVFISGSSPGFLNIMYETWLGRIVMSICLVLYVVAHFWAIRVTEVEV